MEPCKARAGKCGRRLVDLGSPPGGGQRLSASGTPSPGRRNVYGYSILKARDI
jgi:hypothetical protein